MNIAICDDDKSDTERLQELLTNYDKERHIDFSIDTYASGSELLAAMDKVCPDVIFYSHLRSDTKKNTAASMMASLGLGGTTATNEAGKEEIVTVGEKEETAAKTAITSEAKV